MNKSPRLQLIDFDYFVWKWADNDEKGKPNDVFASLMCGHLHPALKPFSENYDDLFKPLLRSCSDDGGTFYQEYVKDKSTGLTSAIHITGKHHNPHPALDEILAHTDLETCSVLDGRMTPCALPKHFCFRFDNYISYPHVYDFEYEELPTLIGYINNKDNAFGGIKNAQGSFIQAYEADRKYCVEWAGWHDWKERTWKQYYHFRAGLKKSSKGTLRLGSSIRTIIINQNEALLFSDVLTCFQAFYRHEPRPSQYVWRNINEEFAKDKLLPKSKQFYVHGYYGT
jgi:hypothetical protein